MKFPGSSSEVLGWVEVPQCSFEIYIHTNDTLKTTTERPFLVPGRLEVPPEVPGRVEVPQKFLAGWKFPTGAYLNTSLIRLQITLKIGLLCLFGIALFVGGSSSDT